MTANNGSDLDRILGEWLGEGAARSPEAPMRAAIDHARAHPRRRDLLAALRSDPMPAGRGGSVLGFAPATIVVVLALTLAVVAGALFVASRPDPVGPAPLPTASPTPSQPATTPTPATPAPTTSRVVTLDTGTGATMTVAITDLSGALVDARSGPAPDGGSVELGQLRIENTDATTLRLTWTDLVCSIDYELEIDAAAETFVLTGSCTDGDTIAQDRELLLTFDRAVDATLVKGVIDPSAARVDGGS